MGKPPPPPPKKTAIKKVVTEPTKNLKKGKTVDLNFKVDSIFKKRFKQAALDEDKTQKDFLKMLFDRYLNK